MLAISDLAVRYGMHEALSLVDIQVSGDEIVVILGANGAGKSTLLSAIAGVSEGEVNGNIVLQGEELLGLDAARIVEKGIAFVPEGRGVFGDLSVQENLRLGAFAEHARHNENYNYERVLSLFPKLEERKAQIVRTMSGGEQQMVAIARALMSAPSILMLDEPSLGLSPLLCKELFASLRQVRDSGVGVLLVEQNAKQSLGIADRGYLLGNGKIVGQDTANNLLNDPMVQSAYLGGAIASTTRATSTATGNPKVTTIVPLPLPDTTSPSMPPTDSLIGENMDALLARADSVARQGRKNSPANPLLADAARHSTTSSVANLSQPKMSLPVTPAAGPMMRTASQDREVQQLLAEFEAAARQVVSGSGNQTKSSTVQATRSMQDNPNDLPHIPVYKKSTVTVYQRDSSGQLRQQRKV